jgi:signal transduction histidine kinase
MTMMSRLDPPLKMTLSRTGRVIAADRKLLRYHFEAGGEENGELALPALLSAAQTSQRLGMALSRSLSIANKEHQVILWCELRPASEGTEIIVRDWRETPVSPNTDHPDGAQTQLAAVMLSDVYLRLDARQRIVELRASSDDLPLPDEQTYLLKYWFDFFHLDTPPDTFSNWEIFRRHIVQFPPMCELADQKFSMTVNPRLGPDKSLIGYDALLHALRSDTGDTSEQPQILSDARLEKIFAGQIGPALRQPIGRIIANAETIGGRLEGPIRSDYANYASDIANAGRHLLALVEDLTDLEAIEDQNFSVASEELELGDLARRAAGLLAVRAAENNIRIDVPDTDEEVLAIGEFRRVLQILLNLVGNAINYSPIGSMIWLRLDQDERFASVTVADQGSGMSAQESARLFQKWERLGRSGDGGSGLGLYISKRLAVAMNGDISVDTAPGQGARFTLKLPRP